MKRSTLIAALALLGLLVGCRSVMDRRISAHTATWQQLSEQDRQRLRVGALRDGDTEEMVRIAFGPPDKILSVSGENGETRTVWVYDILTIANPGSEFDTNHVSYLKMPSDERRITFQDGAVVNRGRVVNRAQDAADIRRKIAEFRAKYDLPASFHLSNPAQIEEFRAIFRPASHHYN